MYIYKLALFQTDKFLHVYFLQNDLSSSNKCQSFAIVIYKLYMLMILCHEIKLINWRHVFLFHINFNKMKYVLMDFKWLIN